MQLPHAFDTFHDRISLGKAQHDRIQSAAAGLITFLAGAYGIPESDVFLQGSYPNGTAVKPADADNGEYDVDIVCVAFGDDDMADDALDDVEAKLAANGNYASHLQGKNSRKTPCVRLFYADDEIGGFHVDVVPARHSLSGDPEASLDAARRGQGWQATNPSEYTAWCLARGVRFSRTVRMLKRWRDHRQDARKSIKSIVLQVLAAEHLGTANEDGGALVATLLSIQAALAPYPRSAPKICNPTLQSEDLAKRWTDSAYRDFLKHLDAAVALAERALAEVDAKQSHALWRELLGPDFPDYDGSVSDIAFVSTVPPPGQAPRVIPSRNRYG